MQIRALQQLTAKVYRIANATLTFHASVHFLIVPRNHCANGQAFDSYVER